MKRQTRAIYRTVSEAKFTAVPEVLVRPSIRWPEQPCRETYRNHEQRHRGYGHQPRDRAEGRSFTTRTESDPKLVARVISIGTRKYLHHDLCSVRVDFTRLLRKRVYSILYVGVTKRDFVEKRFRFVHIF